MKRLETARDRLSIEVLPQEHRQIKAYAAFHGQTIREYVMESVRERLHREAESKDLKDMTAHFGSAFKEVWNNKQDARYDGL